MSVREPFLLVRDVAKAPLRVIVRLISSESGLIAFITTVVIFICDKFVATERMGVGEILV